MPTKIEIQQPQDITLCIIPEILRVSGGTNGGGGPVDVRWGDISGDITDQNDLILLVNNKANIVHTHLETDISDLDKYSTSEVDALLVSHPQPISDITGLQNALNNKLEIETDPTVPDFVKGLPSPVGQASMFIQSDGTDYVLSSVGAGDMVKTTYDPDNINDDAFDPTKMKINAGIDKDFLKINAGAWEIDFLRTEDVQISDRINAPTLNNLSKYLDVVESAGCYKLPVITSNGDGTINIATAEGVIMETPPIGLLYGQLNAFQYLGENNFTLDEGINYVYLAYNGGDVICQKTNDFENIDTYSEITINVCYREGNNVEIGDIGFTNERGLNRVHRRMLDLEYVKRSEGLIISENSNQEFQISQGVVFAGIIKKSIPSFNSTTTTFRMYKTDGAGGYTYTLENQIPNNLYDNLDGTTGTLGSSAKGVFFVYLSVTGVCSVILSRDSYTTSQATDLQPYLALPEYVNTFSLLVGKIIIQKNQTNFFEIKSPFVQEFVTFPVLQHSDLLDLQSDDHPQYSKTIYFKELDNFRYTSDMMNYEIGKYVEIGEGVYSKLVFNGYKEITSSVATITIKDKDYNTILTENITNIDMNNYEEFTISTQPVLGEITIFLNSTGAVNIKNIEIL